MCVTNLLRQFTSDGCFVLGTAESGILLCPSLTWRLDTADRSLVQIFFFFNMECFANLHVGTEAPLLFSVSFQF